MEENQNEEEVLLVADKDDDGKSSGQVRCKGRDMA